VDQTTAASKTALMVCAYRARASKWPKPLFVDPWAAQIAGSDGEAIAKQLDKIFPPFEQWLALRVAYLDRMVGRAVDQLSIRQIVILGAGYDTRAARLPRAGVTFFEVDHPATQAAKREQLARLDNYPIDNARYVSCNFEREDPIDRLAATGFSPTEPALVIWEGVVPYLTEVAVRATATRLATGLDPRSLVAFDFTGKKLVAASERSETAREAATAQRALIADLGEPVRYGSDDILPLLYDCGFRWVRQLDFNELALEMLGDFQRDRQFRFQHIALAAVQTPAAGWP
jgi:methyltransferase (TIGR00027 family)